MLVYCPIFQISLEREVWNLLNPITAILFIVFWWLTLLARKNDKNTV
ncbi:hypothetical protein [Victivallis sp. Marseille-Q1083]